MASAGDEQAREAAAMHGTRRAVAEATRALRMLGLHQVAPSGDGSLRRVALDPEQRRMLLVFLADLDARVKVLDGLASDIARQIDSANRSSSAAALYRRTGVELRRASRQGRAANGKVKS